MKILVVGGDSRVEIAKWPPWCEITHIDTKHGGNSLKRLESTLKANASERIIVLTKWRDESLMKSVKRWAAAPVHYWPRGVGELVESVAMFLNVPPEQQTVKPKGTPRPVSWLDRSFGDLDPHAATPATTPSAPMPPIVEEKDPEPKEEPMTQTEGKRAGPAAWTAEEDEALLLCVKEANGEPGKFLDGVLALTKRTMIAAIHRLPIAAMNGGIKVSQDFLNAVQKEIRARTPKPQPAARKGKLGEYITIQEAAAISGFSTTWVKKQIDLNNVRHRKIGSRFEVSDVDIRAVAGIGGKRVERAPALEAGGTPLNGASH